MPPYIPKHPKLPSLLQIGKKRDYPLKILVLGYEPVATMSMSPQRFDLAALEGQPIYFVAEFEGLAKDAKLLDSFIVSGARISFGLPTTELYGAHLHMYPSSKHEPVVGMQLVRCEIELAQWNGKLVHIEGRAKPQFPYLYPYACRYLLKNGAAVKIKVAKEITNSFGDAVEKQVLDTFTVSTAFSGGEKIVTPKGDTMTVESLTEEGDFYDDYSSDFQEDEVVVKVVQPEPPKPVQRKVAPVVLFPSRKVNFED